MLPYLVVLVVGCALLWSWTDQRDRTREVPLARWRRAGWFSAVLVSVACALIMPLGNVAWPVVLEVPAVALVVLWAPPSARRVAPVALALLGLVGILLVLSSNLPTSAAMQAIPGPHGGSVSGGYAVVAGRAYAWRTVLLLQSVALVAAGVWLLWRHDRRRVPVPAEYAAALLTQLLEARGVKIFGQPRAQHSEPPAETLPARDFGTQARAPGSPARRCASAARSARSTMTPLSVLR